LIGIELPSRPLRLLALGAHADDIEIGAGGTILALLRSGRVAEIDWIVLSGDAVRAAEATASAEALVGGRAESRLRVESFRERFFPYDARIKEYLDALGRDVSPDLVFAPHLADRHQDHRVVAELVWQTFRDHLVWEYEIAKYEGDLPTPNVYVPLDPALVQAKIDHLTRAFPSQAGRSWFDADAFRATLRLRGIECQAPSGYAEGFTARKLVVPAGAS
jgi:LmbE family N-acetylglucosaminyl deacetylase